MKKKIFVLLTGVFLAVPVFANKTSVEISAPESAKTGSEAVIKITVSHKGNSGNHYTEWVKLNVNGKEAAKWSYSEKMLPPGETFTLEKKIKISGDTEIESQGSCNIHGSAGAKTIRIKAEK